MPAKDHFVIIGNGPAGNNAADILRKHDRESRITIISDESVSFYYKHKLPDYLINGMDEESLKVRPYSIYKSNNIRLRLGQRVEKIDPDNRILYLKHMEKVGFTKLVLAVGGTHRVLPTQSRFEKCLTFMTNYTEAVQLKPRLKNTKRITVLGGDPVSLSFIKKLTLTGKEVRFYLYKASFWPFGLTDEIVDEIRKKLRKNKINAIVEDTIEEIRASGKTLNIRTGSGDKFKTDLVLSFMGLTPNINFIAGSGIDIEKGVLVNDHLRTNYKDIFACGDCAQIYNPDIKDYWISIGWENAQIQGKVIAHNILGGDRKVKPVSKKFLDIEGVKVKTPWWKELK